MELKSSLTKATGYIKKYKYVVLIIVLGAVFMMLPSKKDTDSSVTTNASEAKQDEISMEERLSNILKQIDGAGRVEVMLSIAKSENIIFQTDQEVTTGSDSSRVSTTTVTVTDADRNQAPLVQQHVAPVYQGAIIVCQGGDDPVTRLAIMEAVAKITGLKSNSISVLKMK